jgi:hypothetical protein
MQITENQLQVPNQVSTVMITESQLKLYLNYIVEEVLGEINKPLRKKDNNREVFVETINRPKLGNWKQKQDGDDTVYYESLPDGKIIIKCIRISKIDDPDSSQYYKFFDGNNITEYRRSDHWSWYILNYGIEDFPTFGKTTYVDVAWGTMNKITSAKEYTIKLNPNRAKDLNRQAVIDAYKIHKGEEFINMHRKTLDLLDETYIWGERKYTRTQRNH